MTDLKEKRDAISDNVFKEVIEKKIANDISASSICLDLELEEEEVSNYLLGISKNNLPLGLKILNYLESKEESNSNQDN